MTLDETIAKLAQLRDAHGGDTLVVIAKDSEHTHFSPLVDADTDYYDALTDWSGEHYVNDPPDTAVKAVFLWPTN